MNKKERKKKRDKKGETSVKSYESIILRFNGYSDGERKLSESPGLQEFFFNSALLPPYAIHWSEAEAHLGESVFIYGFVTSVYIDKFNYKHLVDHNILETGPNNHSVSITVGLDLELLDTDLLKEVIWGKDWRKWPVEGRIPWVPWDPEGVFQDYEPDFLGRLLCDNTLVVISGIPFEYNDVVRIRITDSHRIMVYDPIKNKFVHPGIVDSASWASYKGKVETDYEDASLYIDNNVDYYLDDFGRKILVNDYDDDDLIVGYHFSKEYGWIEL